MCVEIFQSSHDASMLNHATIGIVIPENDFSEVFAIHIDENLPGVLSS
jgi:hypothetical protein